MATRGDVLRRELQRTGTTQRQLSRLTGVSQGRISTYVTNRQGLSDDMLELLLSPLGIRVEHRFEVDQPEMSRGEELSWRFHLRLSELMTSTNFPQWKPKLLDNIETRRSNTRGAGGLIDRWEHLIRADDIQGLRRIMLDPGPDGVWMRQVGPFVGLLPQEDRMRILTEMGQ